MIFKTVIFWQYFLICYIFYVFFSEEQYRQLKSGTQPENIK